MKFWIVTPLALLFLVSTLGCGEEEAIMPPVKKPKVAYKVKEDLGPVGSIKGVITTTKTPPDGFDQIDPPSDQDCGIPGTNKRPKGAILLKDGKVQNAVVFLSGIKEGKKFPEAKDISVANRKCRYEPRISIGYVGGKLVSPNEDNTKHNVQVAGAMTKTSDNMLKDQEIEMPLKRSGQIALSCSYHNWMGGAIYVLDHPYGDKTENDGAFELTDIPEGTYTLNVWHEALGTVSKEVTVKGDQTHDLTL